MKIYAIPPVSALELMDSADNYFCLAQLYIKHPHYRDFFKQKVSENKWVTLDSGAGDHDIVTPEDLYKVTIDLHPSEVIPPDYLFDGIKTIRALESFIPKVKEINSVTVGKAIEILGCPQGETQSDWLFTYKYMLEHPQVNTIGFSKIAVPYAFLGLKGDRGIKEARHMAYDTLKAAGLIQKPIHLLGLGDPSELAYYKNDPLIRSNDSCYTILSAMNGINFENDHTRIPTPKDYFDRNINSIAYLQAKLNVNWLKNLVK